MIPIKLQKEKVFFVHSKKMAEENNDKSYTMVNQYINNRYLKYIDSYNYYDIDVDKILLFKKSDNEYIRYNDVNKMMIVPLQLKINNSYNEINTLPKNYRAMFIYNDDKEFFRKCIEIWDKIIERMRINNHIYFFLRLMTMMNYLLWRMYAKMQALLLTIIVDMDIIKL